MKTLRIAVFCLAGLLCGTLATAAQWFTVDSQASDQPDTTVEVDLESVRSFENGGESVIRVSFAVLHAHPAGFGYRSLVATAQFDCVRRRVAFAGAAYFALPAGEGLRLGAEGEGRERGVPPQLADSLPPIAKQALLKAICANSPSPPG